MGVPGGHVGVQQHRVVHDAVGVVCGVVDGAGAGDGGHGEEPELLVRQRAGDEPAVGQFLDQPDSDALGVGHTVFGRFSVSDEVCVADADAVAAGGSLL